MRNRHDDLRETIETLVSYPSVPGEEEGVQRWLAGTLESLGFETYEWEPDPEVLAAHESFPAIETLDLADRPSVAGVLELGDPDAGPTVVLNGHADVVPVTESDWTSDPFTVRADGDTLYGRGVLDMKSGLALNVFAARAVADRAAESEDLDGRIVVESVAGEEEGGIGAAVAARRNPYPFERDAAIVTEPSSFDAVVAAEGSLMMRLHIFGKSAHAAQTWEGESVLPHFERIRRAFLDLEAERCDRVTHPLYADYETPWPVNFGTVEAGNWASSVPAELTAEIRIGVAPHETVAAVEAEFRDRLQAVVDDDAWLCDHPPEFERFSVQFEGSEIDPEEPIVDAVRSAAADHGVEAPVAGFTGGTDARHFIDAGIPAVVFGPGDLATAHQPDERIAWSDVQTGRSIVADAVERFLREY
ncbi:ArgE/DapE family deacylase [Halopenitus sp. POP-27]|uniref:M20 family metallopeptidase n=1 Tax=Halopenitus sp. POP-27 TaxID=2994425 RepID=UPI0024691CB0|nr:ArgE/DapE family deacylase [Halopenitus sp. POP-27]